MFDRTELESMLAGMARSGATALHVMSDRCASMRLQGKLVRSPEPAVEHEALTVVVRGLLDDDQWQRLHAAGEAELLHTDSSGTRFRMLVMVDRDGLSVVFRRLSAAIPSFGELALPPILGSLAQIQRGLVLVSGFIGSGKSMTLAAMIDWLNCTEPRHVVTLERTIEYVHDSNLCVVHQRRVGRHAASFAQGVREAVRQSADVIVIGEMVDQDTLSAALDAAERGCLVLASLPASNVAGAMEYAMDLMVHDADRMRDRLATVLRAVTAQTMMPRCHGQGQVPLFEVLIGNAAAARAIRQRDLQALPEIMQRGAALGMRSVDDAVADLLDHNLIAPDRAVYHSGRL